ncbi:DUF6797 domain-containing protein [Paludisphaera borealis]|uniref:Putative carbohydrate dehydrogenase, distantly related to bacterial beta-galactosidase n=1 Tax=Paludisphaera borealis TaxID=1387353 RepID=A0A1U7CW58_9BACT|nr:DUF6797 domain-containing protein [Paludisphaera borealis]APW63165.1 putative carbohydrate dehydrogenase, distantly related to bacterial beta-galactosidase [Paludisphaera borealis]
MNRSSSNRRPSRTWAWIGLLGILTLLTADFIRAQVTQDAAKPAPAPAAAKPGDGLYARDNLIAWCIVPFDSKKRPPEERAAMLERLGFKHFAYDWRAEHIPTFDAEVEALKRHGVSLDAFWMSGELNNETRNILDVLKRHNVKAQLWSLLDFGADKVEGAEQERRVEAAAKKLKPLADEAAKIGCTVALYNHGGWFGEPENQIAIIERLKKDGVANVGVVYNFHHGHDHLDRIKPLLAKMMPYLVALNINGMDPAGDRHDRKILPLGQGELDLELLRTIRESGYHGLIGILGHTMDDAEERLQDNLDGLDWLVPQLDGKVPGPKPTPRTPVAPRPAAPPAAATPLTPEEARQVAALVDAAQHDGDPARGAAVFADARFSCLPCHKVGAQGGTVGPDLTTIGQTLKPEELAESFLWPKRKVKEGYEAFALSIDDGRLIQGYKQGETATAITVREAAMGEVVTIPKTSIEEIKSLGTLMPDGLAATMTSREQADLLSFLTSLGKPGASSNLAMAMPAHGHAPASFPYDRQPLRPEYYASLGHHVNRERIYDFYAKEADYFRKQPTPPTLLPSYPGLDGGVNGHWGNQNEETWADGRWNKTILGSVMSGVFRGAGVTVPKAVCLKLGDQGELSTCFDPQTLCYEALWNGGFVRFTSVRHGFMEGLILDGQPLPRPEGAKPAKPFVYNGFYRHGKRVLISYTIDGEEWLDAPWVEGGKFARNAFPAAKHPLRDFTKGGPAEWPQILITKGKLGATRPYTTDTIEPPFNNPWNALLFFGDHDFLADGTAMICTMQGDVWRVEGLDGSLENVSWRRYASGLHQALGLVVTDDKTYVLGRDQITELQDRNGDGEADYYRCVNNAFTTSPAGHDFICGLQRDKTGDFYSASGPQGLLRIPGDGKPAQTIATGFRNPDGLGLTASGVLTVPNSEGEWVPTSMICEARPGNHFGYPGPKDDRAPEPPMVYLPRGIDNSSGGAVEVTSDRWGPLNGNLVHFSYGAGAAFLVLRDPVDGVPQGAVVPFPSDFLSGVHRGRFSPRDGQLYVSGMAGWGSYTALDGCFQRVRYTGDPVQMPVSFRAVENGVLIGFSQPVDPSIATRAGNTFAQAWNYRYSSGYGSLEYSTRHPGVAGHDPLAIRSVHVQPDGKTLFLEIPEVQPVNTLHLRLEVDAGPPHELFATINKLASPFTDFEGYKPVAKTIAAHPILADMATLKIKKAPNPWAGALPNARLVGIGAGKNLTFTVPSFKVKAGETIKLRFENPDVVPHNWVLTRPGSLARVGDLVNKIIAEPDAAARNYIPRSDDVLVYVDIIDPGSDARIFFKAPTTPGRYPYLCTFPGHWMVMNGVMTVE